MQFNSGRCSARLRAALGVTLVILGVTFAQELGWSQGMAGAPPFDDSALRFALERIVRWHAMHDAETVHGLRPGLSRDGLAHMLGRLPCRLPREVQSLYLWHDGISAVDSEFIWYHYFPSLDRALQNYERLVRDGLLRSDEFPVLEFDGEYYVVHCGPDIVDTSPVWYVFHNPERHINYVSFTAFMQTAAEWYETGAAQATDLRQLRDIHQRHNPGATFPYAVK